MREDEKGDRFDGGGAGHEDSEMMFKDRKDHYKCETPFRYKSARQSNPFRWSASSLQVKSGFTTNM